MYLAAGRMQLFKPASEISELQEGRLLQLVERYLNDMACKPFDVLQGALFAQKNNANKVKTSSPFLFQEKKDFLGKKKTRQNPDPCTCQSQCNACKMMTNDP